ncbi:hydroxymethylglutaryl-CoA lyase [Cypionkella psychrotolerans]|uniref:hydroxymethylglutaryl-CoA lyase n=1 Tax=Cypionkella psychrotolerans TaxID=1678131 RepID=UPI0006B4BB14|nr:hydroxymethylglutaryl-CoA lyase [Cypionkella psychrotolerans]
MADPVTLYEMGPRDGLQNEARLISTADKIKLVNLLSDCGFRHIEVASFVSPKWVPQMADAAEVMAGITRKPGVTYAALTPNLQGFERAITAHADEVAVFASASEGFSQKNINCSISESLERFRPVLRSARTAMIPVRGYVSCVTDCPYDGPIAPVAVAEVAEALFQMGCYQISLGDTLGAATPEGIARMLDAVLQRLPASRLSGHYHDTRGIALLNIAVSLDRGLRVFDSSVGGLGGCPYAPGAKGNVATEAVASMLHGRGFDTGLDLDRLADAATFAQSLRRPA